jgi:hypothetical protein
MENLTFADLANSIGKAIHNAFKGDYIVYAARQRMEWSHISKHVVLTKTKNRLRCRLGQTTTRTPSYSEIELAGQSADALAIQAVQYLSDTPYRTAQPSLRF